jgi:NADH dehydrogenase
VKTIAIVGGGFAGTALLRALDGRLPADHKLLLISEESYTTFNPMLAEAVGASVFPEQVVAPIRQMIRSARFVMGRVTAVDPTRRTLRCETLAGILGQPSSTSSRIGTARGSTLPGLPNTVSPSRPSATHAYPQHGVAACRAHRASNRMQPCARALVTSS